MPGYCLKVRHGSMGLFMMTAISPRLPQTCLDPDICVSPLADLHISGMSSNTVNPANMTISTGESLAQ